MIEKLTRQIEKSRHVKNIFQEDKEIPGILIDFYLVNINLNLFLNISFYSKVYLGIEGLQKLQWPTFVQSFSTKCK